MGWRVRLAVVVLVVRSVGTAGRAWSVWTAEDEGAVEVKYEKFTRGRGSSKQGGRIC